MTCSDQHPPASTASSVVNEEGQQPKSLGLTRKVSQEDFPTMTMLKRSPHYVSGAEDDEDIAVARASPRSCVSEFASVASVSKTGSSDTDMDDPYCAPPRTISKYAPPLPNPLHNSSLRSAHVKALRLEAELQPMRLILSRLMAHPAHNKKGIFNAPVDAAALGLTDYHTVIKKPMDLGSIKSRLYAVAYRSRQDVANDIRLVCQNAMTYNPPGNAVHIAARGLQEFFEELFAAIGGERQQVTYVPRESLSASTSLPQPVSERHVSFATDPSDGTLLPSRNGDFGSETPPARTANITRTVSCDVEVTSAQQKNDIASASHAASTASVADLSGSDTSLVAAGPADLDNVKVSETSLISRAPCLAPAPTLPLQRCLQGTRARASSAVTYPSDAKNCRKRRLSFGLSNKTPGHSCLSCRGRSCLLCEQGCLPLEPTLLICAGANCAGAKIRKGAVYFIAKDGSRQYCQRCHASLPPVLSEGTDDDPIRYKRELLKRKNDEEVVEQWLTCSKCDSGVHQICAMHDSFVHSSEDYVCPSCVTPPPVANDRYTKDDAMDARNDRYTFVTGSDEPLPMSFVADSSFRPGKDVLSADSLTQDEISSFIEAKVRDRISAACNVANAEKTVTVRIISDCDRQFAVPEVIRKHFFMPAKEPGASSSGDTPPKTVNYNSKAIALFQKIDGLDVCVYCMYVQEYDGNDEYEGGQEVGTAAKKRVYIAYLDSVEHFRPRSVRTTIYHELIVSYLASARSRGYESAHIWACPPSRGNSFVFWNHPSSQRTPTREILISWYHRALGRAIECGVVTDVKSLYESNFHDSLQELESCDEEESGGIQNSGKMPCGPLLEGDYWVEEAVRIHSASLSRHLKAKSTKEGKEPDDAQAPSSVDSCRDPCPARQVGSLLIDRIMAHPSAAPFRRPVNAAAMKLKDYHKVITKPMDLGTVYSRCVHGEYQILREVVADVDLVFANAKKYNPVGHFVHNMAIEMETVFLSELNSLVSSWGEGAKENMKRFWQSFAEMSMSLDKRIYVSQAAHGCQTQLTESMVADAPVSPLFRSEFTESSSSHTELVTGGADAVSQRMIGGDTLFTQKTSSSPKNSAKKGGTKSGKRRRGSVTSISHDEPTQKRRRQTWLGEEVGAAVRSLRTSFFTCSLVPKASMSEKEQEKVEEFSNYSAGLGVAKEGSITKSKVVASNIADSRHALLEFSQFRNLEFDTLRHAKYSTAVLLYHLHNENAPGTIPICASCKKETEGCRWHKISKVEELRKGSKKKRVSKEIGSHSSSEGGTEELCTACYDKHPKKDQFIPLHVSFNSS